MLLDFNTAPEQRNIELIPDRAICTLVMTVRPGKGGDGGWLKISKDGGSEGLDAEFTVVEGEHAKRKLWQLFTLRLLRTDTDHETKQKFTTANEISMSKLRAIIESARGINPKDFSEAAQAARKIAGWGDFHGLRFMAQIGVSPAKGSWPAKNVLSQIITPDLQLWKQAEQVPVQPLNINGGGVSANGSGIAPAANATPAANTAPASSAPLAKPDWAK